MLNLNDANLGGDKELVRKYGNQHLSSRKKTDDYPGGTDSPSFISSCTGTKMKELLGNPLIRMLISFILAPSGG